jgi:hypothetical protein
VHNDGIVCHVGHARAGAIYFGSFDYRMYALAA